MAPILSRVVASRHLVCGNCGSLYPVRDLGVLEIMRGYKMGWICVYVQGVQRGGGLGERSGRSEADVE